jgi:hypothetical protein
MFLKMRINFLLFYASLLFFSCHNVEKDRENESAPAFTDKFGWLEGGWEFAYDGNVITEVWRINDDSTLTSASYGRDSRGNEIALEKIELRKRNSKEYYVPVVSGQNQGKETLFEITQSDKTSFTAENKTHDFPQLIRYEQRGADSIYAFVEGVIDSVREKEEFFFTRKK